MATISITISLFSLLIGIFAVGFSVATYLARNRPYVGVKSGDASVPSGNHEKTLMIEVKNVGELPAKDVSIKVRDSGGAIENADYFLGAIFPGLIASICFAVPEEFTYYPDKNQSYAVPISPAELQRRGLREGAVKDNYVYPEGDEATMVTCYITYRGPSLLGLLGRKTFKSIQPFHVDESGKFQPARSKQAEIT